MDIKFTDNSDKVLAEMQAAALRALEKCGLTAEGGMRKSCALLTLATSETAFPTWLTTIDARQQSKAVHET